MDENGSLWPIFFIVDFFKSWFSFFKESPSSLLFVIILLIICTAIVSIFHFNNRKRRDNLKKGIQDLKVLAKNRKVLYEGAVMFNPWFTGIRIKNHAILVTDKYVLINTDPTTKISADSIKEVNFNSALSFFIFVSPIEVVLKDEKTLNLYAAFQNYSMLVPYNPFIQYKLCSAIRSII